MGTKIITAEHVANTLKRIEQGETPRKDTKISSKEFAMRMLPHVKRFLAQGYTYKEIAEFLGHIATSDVKKVVEKTLSPEEKKGKKAPKKPEAKACKAGAKRTQAVKTPTAPQPHGKTNVAKKPAHPPRS